MQALFFGAGASFDCGLPLLWELTAEIRRWLTAERLHAYNEGWKASGVDWHARVSEYLERLLRRQDIHYEHILRSLADARQEADDPRQQRDFHAAYIFVQQLVYALLLERQINNADYTRVVLKDYAGIKKLAQLNKPLWIFSLNHDVIVEQIAACLGIKIKSGFNRTRQMTFVGEGEMTKTIEFEVLSHLDLLKDDCDFFQSGDYGINLVKLHGGLDIFTRGHEQEYLKLSLSHQNIDQYLDTLGFINRVNQTLSVKQGGRVSSMTLYQDDKGDLQLMEKYFSPGGVILAPADAQGFKSLLGQKLLKIDELICIGYRCANKNINATLAQWLGANEERRMQIVDPVRRDLPQELRAVQEQARSIQCSALDYFVALDGYGSVLRRLQRNMRRKIRNKLLRSLTDQT